MIKLASYIRFTITKAILSVLVIVMALEIFILMTTQFSAVSKGIYHLTNAFYYVLLLLPQQTYLLLPMAGLLGMLFGMSLLSNTSELIVMRAAGISPLRITICALQAGFIVMIIFTLIGEGIGPWAKYRAEVYKQQLINRHHLAKIAHGLWLKQGNNFYYINHICSSHEIMNVNQFHFSHHQVLQSISFAHKGFFYNHQWHMQQIDQRQILVDHFVTRHIDQAVWPLSVNPHLLTITQIQPDEITLPRLAALIHYKVNNQLMANNLKIVFWQRLLQPLASLLLMVIAIPWLFGSLREAATSLRLVKGIIAGFIFYMLNQLFPSLSQVLHFSPFLAVISPLVIFSLFGVYLFCRI